MSSKDHLQVYLTPFELEDLHDIADETKWSRTALEGTLADIALRKPDYPELSGERMAADRAIDQLTFELKCRGKQNA